MSSNDEKTIFGATIERTTSHPDQSTNLLAHDNVFDTPKSLSPSVSRDNSASPTSIKKFTPFYSAQSERSHLQVPMKSEVSVYDTDLEAGSLTPSPSERYSSRLELPTPFLAPSASTSRYSVKECSMWPSKQTLQVRAKAEKDKRRGTKCCGCYGPLAVRWSNMEKRQRLWLKILAALFVIAVAVALGIGISRAVGGGVWTSNNEAKQIPDSS